MPSSRQMVRIALVTESAYAPGPLKVWKRLRTTSKGYLHHAGRSHRQHVNAHIEQSHIMAHKWNAHKCQSNDTRGRPAKCSCRRWHVFLFHTYTYTGRKLLRSVRRTVSWSVACGGVVVPSRADVIDLAWPYTANFSPVYGATPPRVAVMPL